MATKTGTAAGNQQAYTVIICFTCSNRVNQPVGTKRTICPYCGSFFDKTGTGSAGGNPRRPHRGSSGNINSSNRASPEDSTTYQRNGSGGRSRTRGGIVGFFSNLKHRGQEKVTSAGKQRKNSADPNSRTSLPPLSPNPLALATTGGTSPRPPDKPKNGQTSKGGGGMFKAESTPALAAVDQEALNKSINFTAKPMTVQEIRSMFNRSDISDDWTEITDFFTETFNSFHDVNSVFKKRMSTRNSRDHSDVGLMTELLEEAFLVMTKMPTKNQQVVVRAMVNCLLQKKEKNTDRDELRGFFVLLQAPIFESSFSFVVLAHLLRGIASLTDYDHRFLVNWMRRLSPGRMRSIVGRLHNFMSVRLFPPAKANLPPLNKCSWWIPSCVRVMALLYAANETPRCPPILPYSEFYNHTLDHLDLSAEYAAWQNPGPRAGFSFCQYPYVLSIQAKRMILQRDSEQQMLVMARKTLVDRVQRKEMPDITMLFLNLNVRRSHLVTDSMTEISRKSQDLKKKLRVVFAGEPGLDMGGLTKEWFQLLIKQVFRPTYGMFSYDRKARVFWLQTGRTRSHQEFHLVGVLMGLAVYNSINLDIRFPPITYRKLLSPAVVPSSIPDAVVGVCPVSLQDLEVPFPDLAHGLRELLRYEGNVEEDMCATFQVTYQEPDNTTQHDLKTNGANIPVTNQNRKEYVELYCDFLLNKMIYYQFRAFYHGFHSVCASNALIMLRPEEVENLVCGSTEFVIGDLSKVTVYDGYKATDVTIKFFWEVLSELSLELQKLFLHFTTGSDRIPVGGIQEMQFRITKTDNTAMLPMSHTCFNQLILPPYKDKKVLKLNMLIAIENSEGFGIE